jgi:hypothetical protein
MGQFNRIEHLASTLSYLYDSDTKTSTFNGAPPVILAIDEATTKLFATTTREAFVGVTGTYTDFPDNSTTIIKGTNTLGVAHDVPVPFTFGATTVLFFNRECEISKSMTKVLLVEDSTLTDNTQSLSMHSLQCRSKSLACQSTLHNCRLSWRSTLT